MNQPEAILEEANRLLEQTGTEAEHPRQVCFLAVQLFEQLEELHHLDRSDRVFLEAACLLHDTGWSRAENGSAHHKHSSDIIREHRWESLTPEQQDLVAQIARYHRKALPKISHTAFFDLKPTMRQKLLSFAALIRAADALDRSHASVIRSLECRPGREVCVLMAQTKGPAEEERKALAKKGDLFELHFSTRLELEVLEGISSPDRMMTV